MRLRLAVEAPEINALRNEIKRTNRRRDKVTIASVVLLGGIVWLAVGAIVFAVNVFRGRRVGR